MILLLFKSFLIGAVMASPFGAVGLYIANNTIRYGLAFGLILAATASIPDVFYAWIAAYGLSMASGFLEQYAYPLEVLGGIIAVGMGIYLWRENPETKEQKSTGRAAAKNKLVAIFVTFGLVALYFKTILFTGIAFAMFSLEELLTGGFMALVVLTIGVALGAFSAYAAIAYATHRARGLLTPTRLKFVYRFAGSVMLCLGASFLITATLKKHFGIAIF